MFERGLCLEGRYNPCAALRGEREHHGVRNTNDGPFLFTIV